MNGFQRGDSLAGVIPSAQNVRGSAPGNFDYAAADIDNARRALSLLANKLHNNRDERDANRVVKLLTQLTDIAMERRKRFSEQQQQGPGGPSVYQGSLHAMGIPQGRV